MNIQSQTKKAMFHEREHENTYTNCAKNLMVDVLYDYVDLLDANTQVNNYENLLYGRTARIERVKYRLSDVCELVMCNEVPPSYFKVRMNLGGAKDALEDIFQEVGLTNFKLTDMTYHVTLQRPSEQKLDELAKKISIICSQQIRKITKVKAETLQRVQKALQNEFISTADAVQAKRQVDKLSKELTLYFKYLKCNAQMKLLGDNFQFDDDFTKGDYARALKLIDGIEAALDEEA